MESDYLTVKELAKKMTLSEQKVRKLISSKEIPFMKIGSRIIFDDNEIKIWLQNKKSGISQIIQIKN